MCEDSAKKADTAATNNQPTHTFIMRLNDDDNYDEKLKLNRTFLFSTLLTQLDDNIIERRKRKADI